ncbi:unnamed protein product [Ambrosiozyma monospora]|uniref:Unnamed protein product n=1 Tax=Ambrosiozyma monospora TaxID=43982 RepID=A0A9W6Z2J4_AMBMO|nr:unnamed protein product [Ambrosiozyma monospora]
MTLYRTFSNSSTISTWSSRSIYTSETISVIEEPVRTFNSSLKSSLKSIDSPTKKPRNVVFDPETKEGDEYISLSAIAFPFLSDEELNYRFWTLKLARARNYYIDSVGGPMSSRASKKEIKLQFAQSDAIVIAHVVETEDLDSIVDEILTSLNRFGHYKTDCDAKKRQVELLLKRIKECSQSPDGIDAILKFMKAGKPEEECLKIPSQQCIERDLNVTLLSNMNKTNENRLTSQDKGQRKHRWYSFSRWLHRKVSKQ